MADSTLISQYDYANDAIGRRTSVGFTGDAFSDLGASYNKYAYNARSELEQAKRYAGTNLASTANAIDGQAYLYGYDLIGNRTETYIGDMLNGSKHTYTANSLNQYTQKTVPAKARIMGSAASDANVTVNNQSTTRYGQYFQSYLDIANFSSAAFPLVSVVGVKKNSGTNGLDVVTTATGHVFVAQTPERFTYDDDGNLTQDGRWSYTWDAENRLIGMETFTNLPSSVPRLKLSFAYDYMSRRISKTVSTFESEIWNQKSQIHFVYDGWNLISELSTANGLLYTNTYVWGLDLSGTLQGAGGIGGLLSSTTQQPSNTTTAFYTFDANGNVGQLVATNGSILARYEYDPYGKLIKDVADVSVRNNPFRFSTKNLDSETGLNYYGFRYYMPDVGRWASRDPIEEEGGIALYVFILNDPMNLTDPRGLEACCAKGCKISNLRLSYHTPPVVMLNVTWDQGGECRNVKLEFWTCTWNGNENRNRRRRGGQGGGGPFDYMPPDGDYSGGWRDGNMSDAYPGRGNILYNTFSSTGYTTIGFKARVSAESCSGTPGEWRSMGPIESGVGHLIFENVNGSVQVTSADVPSI
jgi:RHS repeat-associated protein